MLTGKSRRGLDISRKQIEMKLGLSPALPNNELCL